jgi:ferrous iron transport protein B
MLFIPCMATVAMVRQETQSWGWTFFNMAFLLVVSVLAGTGVYHLASALGL